jgi:hypothetical protein
MNSLVRWVIGWTERFARHLQCVAPLFVGIVVSWVLMWSGSKERSNADAIGQQP